MKTTKRVPHAPAAAAAGTGRVPAPVPRPLPPERGAAALERYLTGLLTEHPNKNCDTIAQVVPGTSEQRLQGLLTEHRPGTRTTSTASASSAMLSPAHRGRCRPDLRRHRLRQARPVLRRRRPPVLRHPGQDRQLSGHRQLPLRRDAPWPGRSPPGSTCPSTGPTIPSAGSKANVPEEVTFQTKPADRLGPARPGPRPGACRTPA